MFVYEANPEIPRDYSDLYDEHKCHECGSDAKINIESDHDSTENFKLVLCGLCARALLRMLENAKYIQK